MTKKAAKKPRNTMKRQFEAFRQNMDGWVKEISTKQTELDKLANCICKNCEDIETNLVLIYLQQAQISQLQNDIGKLKGETQTEKVELL